MTPEFIKQFLTCAFVGIVRDTDRCDVFVRVFKGKKEIKSESHTFRIEDGVVVRTGAVLLKGIYDKYYFTYAGSLLLSINQGAFPGLGEYAAHSHSIKTDGSKIISTQSNWSIFASEGDLTATKQDMERLGGLDYVFSSFCAIDQIKDERVALYILRLHGWASVAVFDGENLRYGNFLMFMSADAEEDDGVESSLSSDGDDLEDAIAMTSTDDEEEQNDMQADFTDTSEDGSDGVASLENDMKLIEFTQLSLHDFYKNYDSTFIERIVVIDPYDEAEEFRVLAQEELMLDIEIKKVNLAQIVCDFVQKEAAW